MSPRLAALRMSTTLVVLVQAHIAFAAVTFAQVEAGQLSGIQVKDSAVAAFLGVPFAAPPVGEARWKSPQPVERWTGVRKAEKFAASCMQPELTGTGPWTREFYAKPPYSEDCLYLNVWTPATRQGEKLPVAVWIHGGGFDQGGADEAIYYGTGLAEKGVVFVSLNYRMGVFGFYAHPELSKESPLGTSGNYAFQDQIAALRWVQRNIAAFGGDPSSVTLVGQSAGATSIEVLLVSPLAKGLFHRAISESGFMAKTRIYSTLAAEEQLGIKYAESKGARSIAEMRAIPASELIQVRNAPIRFLPIADGVVLPDNPDRLIAAGRFSDLPLLTGWNAAEGAVPFDRKVTLTEFQKQARDQYGSQADSFLGVYPAGNDEAATLAAQASDHDRIIVSAYAWNAIRSKSAKSNVYFYEFAHVLPGPSAVNWGAFHSAEVVYVLSTLDGLNRPFTENDRQLAHQLSGFWVNFIRSGNPNGKGLPEWPAFVAGTNAVMELSEKSAVRAIAPVARLHFMEGVFDAQ